MWIGYDLIKVSVLIEPRQSDLSGYTQEQLDAVADELNGRPRMTLGYSTPLEVYAQHLQRLSFQADSVH